MIVLLRRAVAHRRARYASATPSPVTPRTFQPRNFVLQGVSVGDVHLQLRLAEHDMEHISGDYLMAIAEYVNHDIAERVAIMRNSRSGA